MDSILPMFQGSRKLYCLPILNIKIIRLLSGSWICMGLVRCVENRETMCMSIRILRGEVSRRLGRFRGRLLGREVGNRMRLLYTGLKLYCLRVGISRVSCKKWSRGKYNFNKSAQLCYNETSIFCNKTSR